MDVFIRCEAILVPASHYEGAAGVRAIQLQLSFDVMGPPDGHSHVARERFETFLTDAPEFEFRLCTIKDVQPEAAVLQRLGAPPQPPTATTAFGWLDARADLWHTETSDDGSGTLFSAGQLLAASARWAPGVARDTGLSAIVSMPDVPSPAGKIILPYPKGDVPRDIEWIEENGKTYAVYKVGEAGAGFTVEAFAIDEAGASGNELVDPATGMLHTAGGLAVDEKAHLVHEMLGALALRGASQLSAAHALLGIEWPRFEAATPEEQATRDFGRLVFRGISTLAALFDPILLGLVMPGSEDEGPFIGAMMTALGDALESGQQRVLGDAVVEATVAGVKQRVAAYLALPGTGAAARKEFAAKLAGLIALAPKPPEGHGDPILPDLLKHFEAWEPGTARSWSDAFGAQTPTEVEQRLVKDLGHLLQWLESENGSEAVALELLELCLPSTAAGELAPDDKSLAIAALDARMKDNFNGADAARAAVGTLFVDALVAAARKSGPYWSADDLRAALDAGAGHWFLARIWPGARAGNPFEAILAVLPTLGLAYLDPGDADPATAAGPLWAQLDAAWRDARRLLLGNSDQIRFARSDIPLPLPVRINADADVKQGDLFAQDYAGLGVLIRRKGELWAHANLATFVLSTSPYGKSGPPDLGKRPWVEPIAPAAVNGRRELFKNYEGFAFSEADLGPPPEEQTGLQLPPYYRIDAPERAMLDAVGQHALPALAYGIDYELASFAVLRGGVLPAGLAVPGEPWRPRRSADIGTISPAYIATQTYRRTTMIGAVGLVGEGLSYPNEPGIGVQPLSADYPRKAMASKDEPAWFDLWRSSDGSGAIDLPAAGDTIRLTLDDIALWGGAAAIGIHIQSHPASVLPAHAAAQLTARIPAAVAGQRLELVIGNSGGTIDYELRSPLGGIVVGVGTFAAGPTDVGGEVDVPVFVRLSLAAETAAAASLSFADPAQALRSRTDGTFGDSSVMLAAPSAEFIAPRGGKPVGFRLDYPRIAYLDFERWLGNPLLAKTVIPDETEVKALRTLLLRSYLEGAAELADTTASLPDPAVRHLLVELTPLDGLADEPKKMAATHKATRAVIDLPSLSEIARAPTLAAMFRTIDAQFGAEWTIVSGPELKIDSGNRRIFVPEGMTAQLSVKPLVLDALFTKAPEALDPRLLQWSHGPIAIGTGAGRLDAHRFEGPSRTIEMMASFSTTLPDFADRAFDFIGVDSAGTARSYALGAAAPAKPGTDDWQWRRFASAEVKVQQWRFMGRPILHWFDPKALSHAPAPGRASLRLDKLDGADFADLERFEAEAFLDRDEDDAQLHVVGLEPLDIGRDGGGGVATTVLHRFEWSDASATMVRHRLALLSRYAGALAKPSLARVEVIGAARPPAEKRNWLRVVILADAARLDLTRPQLRALIPMTVAGDAAATPPVLALLDEAPLAHGGLAGRIAASIRTSLGFAVPPPDPAPTAKPPVLELDGARAEFGPDPQLRYRPTRIEAARALTLLPEGPIGLTFDAASVRAPAFANSAMMLTPKILHSASAAIEKDLQEHFASVALRRYLDPLWLVEDAPVPDALPADRSWWIECRGSETISYRGKALCRIVHGGGLWTVDIADRTFVFGFGTSKDPLDLVAIDADQAEGIALLHQPLANGRASLAIFAIPSAAAIKSGIAATPLALASVEWSEPKVALLDQTLTGTARLTAHAVVASAETPMNWVRTARDSDRVDLGAKDGTAASCHVRDLRIVASRAVLEPRIVQPGALFHLRPPHEASPVALGLQRRFALVKTRLVAGPGQRIETFEGAHLVLGAALPVVAADAREGARARIVELEMKAVPVAAGNALDIYKSAHFDLVAIGREQAPVLSLWMRPVGSFRACKAGFALAFDLEGLAGSGWPDRRVSLRAADGAAFDCRSILVCASKDAVHAWFLKADGATVAANATVTVTNPPGEEGDREAVRIAKLDVRDGTGPLVAWWADVGMLTLKAMPAATTPPRIDLDFDWIFTGTLDRPADAVAHAGLMGMKEAEARMLGASEPIDII